MKEMDLQYLVQRASNILLAPFHLAAVSSRDAQEIKKRTCMQRLALAKSNGFSPAVILDGGAYHGLWTRQAAQLFPGAQFLLVEPNPAMKPIINGNLSQLTPAPLLVEAAIGDAPGKATLNLWRSAEADPGASLLQHVSGEPGQTFEVEVTTLDAIANQFNRFPDLLKLDLQGGELAALRGAEQVLARAECAVIEFSCLEAYLNRATPLDLLDVMYSHDYCLYDIVGLSDRPHDGALMGGDFIFVKNNSSLRAYKGWA